MKNRILFSTGIALIFVFVILTIKIKAQSNENEVIYLSETQPIGGDFTTSLFQVNLDPATKIAELFDLPDAGHGLGKIPFDRAHLACTPDGKKLYAVDFLEKNQTGYSKPTLGYLEVDNSSWHEIGTVKIDPTTALSGMGQAAFSTDGVLYVLSNHTDSLYTVDTGTAEATLVGKLNIVVQGADIAFAEDETLYLYTNASTGSTHKGLYIVTLPPDSLEAIFLGPLNPINENISGLAIRVNGYGDLLGSAFGGKIYVIDKSDGSYGESLPVFKMQHDNEDFPYEFGDMSLGPFALCTRSIGYWKNHSWNNVVITICGIKISETLGNDILWEARGKNFSMLFAQLIAAKLNTNNSTGIPEIDDAEVWLSSQPDIINLDLSLNWNKDFHSKQQKREAVYFWEALDAFNNMHECEGD
jgi:hypothetical protein